MAWNLSFISFNISLGKIRKILLDIERKGKINSPRSVIMIDNSQFSLIIKIMTWYMRCRKGSFCLTAGDFERCSTFSLPLPPSITLFFFFLFSLMYTEITKLSWKIEISLLGETGKKVSFESDVISRLCSSFQPAFRHKSTFTNPLRIPARTRQKLELSNFH